MRACFNIVFCYLKYRFFPPPSVSPSRRLNFLRSFLYCSVTANRLRSRHSDWSGLAKVSCEKVGNRKVRRNLNPQLQL